jgi:hypothetical protein
MFFAVVVLSCITVEDLSLIPFLKISGYTVKNDGSLVIQNAGLRDAGIYICIAQNNAGTSLGQVRLEVEGKNLG